MVICKCEKCGGEYESCGAGAVCPSCWGRLEPATPEPPIAPGQEEWEKQFAYLHDCVAYFEAHATVDLPQARLDVLRAEHHERAWSKITLTEENDAACAEAELNRDAWGEVADELSK